VAAQEGTVTAEEVEWVPQDAAGTEAVTLAVSEGTLVVTRRWGHTVGGYRLVAVSATLNGRLIPNSRARRIVAREAARRRETS
jgi:hypothetical protein